MELPKMLLTKNYADLEVFLLDHPSESVFYKLVKAKNNITPTTSNLPTKRDSSINISPIYDPVSVLIGLNQDTCFQMIDFHDSWYARGCK